MNSSFETALEIEVILLISTPEQSLFDAFKPIFADDDITLAKRAVGGAEIKAWFVLGKEVLSKILDVLVANRGKISDATIIIGAEEISIKGYDAEDAIAILESTGMKKAISAYAKRKK